MVKIKRKIQSQRGASMLLALLAFLVAAVVSVIIVSAALTNVKRVHSDREAQQNHLTLISAAQLVRDEMENTKYVYQTTTTVTYDENGNQSGSTTSSSKGANGTFASEIQPAVESVDDYNNIDFVKNNAFSIEKDGLKPVQVSIRMKANTVDVSNQIHDLVFTFTMNDSAEMLTLTMIATSVTKDIFDSETGEKTSTHTTTTTINWISPVISTIGDSYG